MENTRGVRKSFNKTNYICGHFFAPMYRNNFTLSAYTFKNTARNFGHGDILRGSAYRNAPVPNVPVQSDSAGTRRRHQMEAVRF